MKNSVALGFCTAGILLLSGCMTTNGQYAEPSSTILQRVGNDLGGSVVSTKQGRMEHSVMGSMPGADHTKIGGVEGIGHFKMAGMSGRDHSQMQTAKSGTSGHPQGANGKAASGHGGHGTASAGQSGDPAKATRTITVKARDTMRFEPGSLQVKSGETVRFVVTNVGKVPHEFVIGTPQEQQEHEQMMQKMTGMKHEEEKAVSLAPGQTKTLVWQFGKAQKLEAACHVPGHYPAGMVSTVTVVESTHD